MRRSIINMLISLLLLLLLFIMLPSRSMAASQEKIITNQVNKYLGSIPKQDYKTIEKTMTPTARKTIARRGSRFEKIIKRMYKYDFSYNIKNIKITGKRAEVTVRVKYYDAYVDYEDAFKQMLKKLRKEYLSNPQVKWSKSYTDKVWADYLLEEYYDNTSLIDADDHWDMICVRKKTITIPLSKSNGKWRISENTKAMQDMTDNRITSSHNKILKNIDSYDHYFILGF